MNESILTSIKKLLGVPENYEQFDMDITIHINSVFMILNQLGIGPSDGFSITDKTALWSDFISDNKKLEAIKSYMYMKVRLMFDPPSSSAVMDCMNRTINEMEWRLNAEAESN